jgi:hypothetical protein
MLVKEVDMQIQDIDRYLTQLGQELSISGVQQPVRILIIGGTFMLTQVGNRSITDDVDVVFKDILDRKASPVYQATLQAVKTIAARNRLREDWLNDGFSHMLRGMSGIPEGTLWRKYDMLEVYLPPIDYILALKLLAYRDKDRDDIEALFRLKNIQTREQAQRVVNQCVPNPSAHRVFGLEETLDKLF